MQNRRHRVADLRALRIQAEIENFLKQGTDPNVQKLIDKLSRQIKEAEHGAA